MVAQQLISYAVAHTFFCRVCNVREICVTAKNITLKIQIVKKVLSPVFFDKYVYQLLIHAYVAAQT